MTRVLVLQGPNMDLLGVREPEIYGTQTLHDLQVEIQHWAVELGLEVVNFQSNHEGDLIDRIHEHDFDAAIVNAGGLAHTSIALRDALLAVNRPFVEVHLTDPTKREAFRKVNFLADIAIDRVYGQGPAGYRVALEVIARRFGTAGGGGR